MIRKSKTRLIEDLFKELKVYIPVCRDIERSSGV